MDSKWAIYAIPRFWKAPVGWLIRLNEVPNETAMRAACRALVRRHSGLRARPYPSSGDEVVAQLCMSGAPVVATLRSLLGRLGGGSEGFCARASEGLLRTWPQVVCTSPTGCGPQEDGSLRGEEVAHFEWHRLSTEADLRHAAWMRARSRGFKIPASIGCLVLAGGGGDGEKGAAGASDASGKDVAYLHVAVNHAVTDAASIVPLVVDLLELHAAARKAEASLPTPAPGDAPQAIAATATTLAAGHPEGSGASPASGSPPAAATALAPPPQHADVEALALAALASAKVPPAPNGLAAQEVRLRASLLQEAPVCGSSRPAVEDGSLDLVHNAFNPRRKGYDHYIRLLPGACRVLEVAARVLGAPPDHLLVASIALAFGQIANRDEVKLSLIVPMRDGKGEGQAVANLATTRHLSLFVGGGRSLLASALEFSGRIRRREWELCDVLRDDGDRLFINVRGIPSFEGAKPVMEPVDTKRQPTRFVRNLIEMFADQESAEQWTFWMGIREDIDGTELARAMRRAIWGLAVNPLQPLNAGPLPAVGQVAPPSMAAAPPATAAA